MSLATLAGTQPLLADADRVGRRLRAALLNASSAVEGDLEAAMQAALQLDCAYDLCPFAEHFACETHGCWAKFKSHVPDSTPATDAVACPA